MTLTITITEPQKSTNSIFAYLSRGDLRAPGVPGVSRTRVPPLLFLAVHSSSRSLAWSGSTSLASEALRRGSSPSVSPPPPPRYTRPSVGSHAGRSRRAAAHRSHARLRLSEPGTLMREREQSAHTSWPHARQWCRRRSSPHLPPHSRQCVDTASLSHCTPYLASCVLAPREPPSKRERRRRGRPARSSACTGGRASCRERRCRRACVWAARGW